MQNDQHHVGSLLQVLFIDIIEPTVRPRKGSITPAPSRPPKATKKPRLPHGDLWDLRDKFSFKVVGASQLSCDTDSVVGIL